MKFIDLTGQVVGRLTVVAQAPAVRVGVTRWYCDCACGTRVNVAAGYLREKQRLRKEFTSCGCFASARISAANFKHGGKGTPEYSAWSEAKNRCTNPKHPAWKNYGARGIDMCAEWRSSFPAFLKHIGPRPIGNFELDRIDNAGNYEPGNVRWTTLSVQHQNRRYRFRRLNGTFGHLSDDKVTERQMSSKRGNRK